jgi:glycerol-3-phosphate acyltransferase PlsX
MMKIIVDAFGGDNAPLEIIKGAVLANEKFNVDICFTGKEDVIKKVAAENNLDISKFEIVNAPSVIPVDESPNAIMKEYSDSSMAVGLKMVAEGNGDGFVSAGNSGALCVGGTLIVKRLKGVKRPGFAPILPTFNGSSFMLLDGGANLDARPEILRQFAILGSVYMENVMHIANPRVALANVGTESHKGGDLQKDTYKLLSESSLNFIGNVESRDISEGACDVYVCDGFTGNLILKNYEGVAKSLSNVVSGIFKKNIKNKIGAIFVYKDLMKFKSDMSSDKYGGAPILGVKKPVFKAHGSSNATTIYNAIRIMIDYINANVPEKIEKSFNEIKENSNG